MKTFNVEANAVSVVNDCQVVSVLTDVGWHSSKKLFINSAYREKLKENLFAKENPTRYCRSNC